jgi:predicted PolB exonuclease-like 3'-5' exonuclease
MLNRLPLSKILFLDIETVPQVYRYEDLSKSAKELWDAKMQWLAQRDQVTPGDLYEKAGIYAEFAKIVCISVGYFVHPDSKIMEYRMKSFYHIQEAQILTGFSDLLTQSYFDQNLLLCAHNGKEFDFPFIARRTLINGFPLPGILEIAGKKPWEVQHLDTMELWKFGDYKHYTSLSLLAHVFDIPTPKEDITGADVARVFYEEKDLERIAQYCERDTLTVAQLFLKFSGRPLLKDHQIHSM